MATSILGFPEMDDSDPLADVAAHQRASFDAVDAYLRLTFGPNGWQNVAVGGGTNLANVAGYPVSRYRKLAGDRAVRVEVALTRSVSIINAGTTIFTLAAGYRPTAGGQVIIGMLSTGLLAQFTVATTGAVTCHINIGVGTSFVMFGEISLD